MLHSLYLYKIVRRAEHIPHSQRATRRTYTYDLAHRTHLQSCTRVPFSKRRLRARQAAGGKAAVVFRQLPCLPLKRAMFVGEVYPLSCTSKCEGPARKKDILWFGLAFALVYKAHFYSIARPFSYLGSYISGANRLV